MTDIVYTMNSFTIGLIAGVPGAPVSTKEEVEAAVGTSLFQWQRLWSLL